MQKIYNWMLSHKFLSAFIITCSGFFADASASFAQAVTTTVPTPDLVTGGTTGLSSGVSVLVAFLYSALPILLALAVAAAIVRWVVGRIGRGAH